MAGQESQARVSDDISKGSLIFGTHTAFSHLWRAEAAKAVPPSAETEDLKVVSGGLQAQSDNLQHTSLPRGPAPVAAQ